MMRHNGSFFTNTRVELDGNSFEGCAFDGCRIVFSGKAPCELIDCTFNNSPFAFEGPAALTVDFLTKMYRVAGPMIEATLQNIRAGRHPG